MLWSATVVFRHAWSTVVLDLRAHDMRSSWCNYAFPSVIIKSKSIRLHLRINDLWIKTPRRSEQTATEPCSRPQHCEPTGTSCGTLNFTLLPLYPQSLIIDVLAAVGLFMVLRSIA